MNTYEQEEKNMNRLLAAIIKTALDDLYKPYVTLEDVPPKIKKKEEWVIRHNLKILKHRVEARNFFEKSNLFSLTKLNYEALKTEYKRINNISDEQEKRLEEEDKLYVIKQEFIEADAERSEKPKDTVKTSKRTRGKLRYRFKQRKRSVE